MHWQGMRDGGLIETSSAQPVESNTEVFRMILPGARQQVRLSSTVLPKHSIEAYRKLEVERLNAVPDLLC